MYAEMFRSRWNRFGITTSSQIPALSCWKWMSRTFPIWLNFYHLTSIAIRKFLTTVFTIFKFRWFGAIAYLENFRHCDKHAWWWIDEQDRPYHRFWTGQTPVSGEHYISLFLGPLAGPGPVLGLLVPLIPTGTSSVWISWLSESFRHLIESVSMTSPSMDPDETADSDVVDLWCIMLILLS